MSKQDLRGAITPSHRLDLLSDFEMLLAEVEERLRVRRQEQPRKDAF